MTSLFPSFQRSFGRVASCVALCLLLFPGLAQAQVAAGTLQPPADAGEKRFQDAAILWAEGRYPDALRAFDSLLASNDANKLRKRIALFTGENWQTTLVAEDARNPRWSPDARYIAMELGTGANRVTRIVSASDLRVSAELKGTNAVFSPDGNRVAYVTGTAANGALVERTLASGNERTITDNGLLKAQLAYSHDGTRLYVVGASRNGAKTELFATSPNGTTLEPLISADSSIADVQVSPDGRTLVYSVGGRSALGGGGAFSRFPRNQFVVYDIARRTSRIIVGQSPVLSADGKAMVFLKRAGDTTHVLRLTLDRDASLPWEVLASTTNQVASPAISPDGSRVVYQQMLAYDWELFVVRHRSEGPIRLTREIQHNLMPRFLDNRRVLAMMGEGRHRRSYIYDTDSLTYERLFHNNTVRTIAPEYEWVPSPDATRVLVVAERDGDTVTPHRHLWLVDLRHEVSVAELRERIADNLAAEIALRAEGSRRFAPIADAVRAAVAEVSTDRIYRYEKALFDFDSKHVTQPGNVLAREFLMKQYTSFGLQTKFQPFEARAGMDRAPVPTANVLAVLPGTENPELVYVVSSHFDSRAEGPGADDNTSGTAALLEAARVLSTRPQPATIIFASFTGEESGLLGSREFVRQAKADGLKLVGALNNDMLGWSNDNRLDNTIRYSNAGIRDLQHAAAFLFTNMITYDAFYYKSTDAAAFYDGYGDIVGGIGSYPVLGNPHYHQPHDVLEVENHQLIAEASKTTIASLIMLASSPSRIAGLAVNGTTATWTPSPEKGVTKYLVRYGPADAPERWSVEVTEARAVLPNLRAGMTVAVKAVNSRGLEGWDWARVNVGQ